MNQYGNTLRLKETIATWKCHELCCRGVHDTFFDLGVESIVRGHPQIMAHYKLFGQLDPLSALRNEWMLPEVERKVFSFQNSGNNRDTILNTLELSINVSVHC